MNEFKYTIEPVNLSHQKILDWYAGSLKFSKDYIRYYISFLCENRYEDSLLQKEEVFVEEEMMILKSSIAGVTRFKLKDQDVYQLEIHLIGCQDDIHIHIVNREESIMLQQKILNYITNA